MGVDVSRLPVVGELVLICDGSEEVDSDSPRECERCVGRFGVEMLGGGGRFRGELGEGEEGRKCAQEEAGGGWGGVRGMGL